MLPTMNERVMRKMLNKMISLIRGTPAAGSRRQRRGSRRFFPEVEPLEDRRLMSLTTDYTQIAQMFPRHPGSTNLYLNFDGWQAEGVAAFEGTTQDIQEILFRTAEIFSPFDVQ